MLIVYGLSKGGLLHPVGREKQEKFLLCPSKYKFLLFSIFSKKKTLGTLSSHFFLFFSCRCEKTPVSQRSIGERTQHPLLPQSLTKSTWLYSLSILLSFSWMTTMRNSNRGSIQGSSSLTSCQRDSGVLKCSSPRQPVNCTLPAFKTEEGWVEWY